MPTRTETPTVRRRMREWYKKCAPYVDGEIPLTSPQNEEAIYRRMNDEGNRILGETEVLARSVRTKPAKDENNRNIEDIKFALDEIRERHVKNIQEQKETVQIFIQESN